jgi:hypothetical protein
MTKKNLTMPAKDWSNIMADTPDNEKAVDAFEIDIMEVILKHRANEGYVRFTLTSTGAIKMTQRTQVPFLSALEVSATLINILFVMATTQPNPKAAVDHLKEALDKVCKLWIDANKPDLIKGIIARCLAEKLSGSGKCH